MSLAISHGIRNPAGEAIFRLLESTPVGQQTPRPPDLTRSNDVQAAQAAILTLQTIVSAVGSTINVLA